MFIIIIIIIIIIAIILVFFIFICKENFDCGYRSFDAKDDYSTSQVVETSVINNSLSEDYSHLDDHTRHTALHFV